MKKYNIVYILSDLKRVGPTNQTLNIIKYSKYKDSSLVITLFEESKDTLKEEYIKNNINVVCLRLNRKFFLFQISKLKRLIKIMNPSIIHTTGIIADYVCNKINKRISFKHIITLRNYPKEDITTRMSNIKAKIALKLHLYTLLNCDNVVCCSKAIADRMKNDYPNKEFLYIQNGVDTDKYSIVTSDIKNKLRSLYSIPSDSKVFICTNSFIPRKRINETIELYNTIPEDNKILLLLGNGSLYESIHNKYSNRKDIVFVGKTNKVSEYLNLSDYFISTSESEGLPNAVLEAISCGIPTILSDIPQHTEILDELNEVGFVYELGNVSEVKDKYLNYNNIPASRIKELINNSKFTMNYMSSKYVELYTKVGDIDG